MFVHCRYLRTTEKDAYLFTPIRRFSGIAQQLTMTNGCWARGLSLQITNEPHLCQSFIECIVNRFAQGPEVRMHGGERKTVGVKERHRAAVLPVGFLERNR